MDFILLLTNLQYFRFNFDWNCEYSIFKCSHWFINTNNMLQWNIIRSCSILMCQIQNLVIQNFVLLFFVFVFFIFCLQICILCTYASYRIFFTWHLLYVIASFSIYWELFLLFKIAFVSTFYYLALYYSFFLCHILTSIFHVKIFNCFFIIICKTKENVTDLLFLYKQKWNLMWNEIPRKKYDIKQAICKFMRIIRLKNCVPITIKSIIKWLTDQKWWITHNSFILFKLFFGNCAC